MIICLNDIQLLFHTPAKVTCREYKIGRLNVPKSDPKCGKHPDRILETSFRILSGEDVDASFLLCDNVRRYEDGKDAEIIKPSQTAA
ncbi:hypothetical protein B5F32_01515 [Parabacteroides distasonis]|uniref:Uncharacterized protein n=1 Tax=Parabacteroides distasonis TaxID=823 RepID=A0A1Y4ITU5_PARDI|nr:hypothetical protein [Parabacteroides distasonis]OUP22896.1 hypothetical protein B5F32_01515 [Parabacteroides distasonis]